MTLGQVSLQRGRAQKRLIIFLLFSVCLGITSWVLRTHYKNKKLIAPEIFSQAKGYLENLDVVENKIHAIGWVLSVDGIREVVVMLNGRDLASLPYGLARDDVAQLNSKIPNSAKSGFDGWVVAPSMKEDIQVLEIVAVDGNGRRKIVGKKTIVPAEMRKRWHAMLGTHGGGLNDIFYIPIATSYLSGGGGAGIKETFSRYESETVKVGVRVQILYMRTTGGALTDYKFDPDFSVDKKCGNRRIAEDSLNDVIRFSIVNQTPVLFTLNGGFWADASCEAAEWDINDVLERDEALCQWNEQNQVMPDSYLSNQAGSFASPELGRSLSLNIYAEKARFYKKRNLQQAASKIHDFALAYPHLFIGISLDPDVYINPFFEGKQWYDYNPGTIRQFREWLQGSGPYGDANDSSLEVLKKYKRQKQLTLADVNALAGEKYANWNEVDPPRHFSMHSSKFWKNPWFTEWEHFRRQLVGLHYDELSQWVAQTGIDVRHIYSAQGFMSPGVGIDPFPIRIDSPAKNYDTGGMSIEGSKPSSGRLGAIVYGKSSVNTIRMEASNTLFAEFRRISPDWAVVEYNTADLLAPKQMASYADGYQSLRDIANYGARFVSPMAWNGSSGLDASAEGFISYTSLRNSPLEEAIQHFMVLRADLPRSARLWEFGVGAQVDTDKWTVVPRPTALPQGGEMVLLTNAQGEATMMSPNELAWKAGEFESMIVQADVSGKETRIHVEAQVAGGSWQVVIPEAALSSFPQSGAGAILPIAAGYAGAEFDRMRVIWHDKRDATLHIQRIALYPSRSGEPAKQVLPQSLRSHP